MTPLSVRKRRLILILCTLAFLAVLPILAYYTMGYRLSSDYRVVKTGGFYIWAPVTGASIELDGQSVRKTNILQSGFLIQNLKLQKYTVATKKDGRWPWIKNLYIEEGLVTEARAMMLPEKPEILSVEKKSDEYISVTKLFVAQAKMATSTVVHFTDGNKQKLTLDIKKQILKAEWLGNQRDMPYFFCSNKNCNATTTIIAKEGIIKNFSFFPNRPDVIIVSFKNDIYAMEIDERGGRNMQPVYKGVNPSFIVPSGESFIYILDEGTLSRLTVE